MTAPDFPAFLAIGRKKIAESAAQTEAYRFNSAAIRVRVIDDRFEGKSIAEREAMVWPLLKKLPKKTRDDVLLLLTLAPCCLTRKCYQETDAQTSTIWRRSTPPGSVGVHPLEL